MGEHIGSTALQGCSRCFRQHFRQGADSERDLYRLTRENAGFSSVTILSILCELCMVAERSIAMIYGVWEWVSLNCSI